VLNYINSGRILFGQLENGVYDIIPFLEPGLMVDCGAAIGGITTKLRANSPQSPVIAFEPFPGNHPHFEKRHSQDPLVTLYKAAVGAKRAKTSFFTPSVVRSPARKKATPGASFVGRLDQTLVPDGNKIIEVDVYPLDDVCHDRIRFLKIDIQGGESDALDGASKLINTQAIDIIYIELMRSPELLKQLSALEFILFDTEYLVTPKEAGDLTGWRKTRETTLSTGRASVRAWPDHAPAEIDKYNEWVVSETEKVGSFTTDIVAVRKDFISILLTACGKALQATLK
jgi:FkbM family methyltransferase